jgi:hypothetical protein
MLPSLCLLHCTFSARVLLAVVLVETGRCIDRNLLACSRCCISRMVCMLTASFHC